MWAFGLGWGMICLGCIAIVPIEEEPSSTPARQSSSLPQEAPSAPSEPGSVRQEPGPTPSIKAEPEHKKAFYVHIVKWGGETISIIAAWYTGDHQNWKAIAQANPQIDLKLIHEGDKILIPERLLRTREPLPKEFINRFYSKFKKEKPLPETEDTRAQEEEPKPFGPRKYPAK